MSALEASSEFMKLFGDPESLVPRGYGYLGDPPLLWLHVISNVLIALASIVISLILGYLVYRVRDIPFKFIYLAFTVFIIQSGIAHLLDVWLMWEPIYWLDGVVRAIAAVASVGAAIALRPLVPKAIALARAARAARERGTELETAVRNMERMYLASSELERLKTQFFANVSHELRTPLTLILGPLDKLLHSTNLNEEQRHDLELIRRNGQALLKHVTDLLDVSKLEAGKAVVHYARLDLARLVRTSASHFEALASERNLILVVDTPESFEVQADPEKIERVVLNLLSNAFKFTPTEGIVRCRLEKTSEEATGADEVLLTIADSGPGIRPQLRQMIFERFAQIDASVTRPFGGTGLGLAISKEFVELHGGKISVEQAEEGGALFLVRLPVEAPSGVEIGAENRESELALAAQAVEELRTFVMPPTPVVLHGRGRVLVVEDNVDMNRFVRQVLSPDYLVDVAYDGKEALDKALKDPPDLIVTDVMMPKMSGDQLVAALREREQFQDVPIVLLTAKTDESLRIKLLRDGAQDYVMKPFAPDELRARVANLVTIKRARDLLQAALELKLQDVETLARECALQKRELSAAFDALSVARDQALRASDLKTNFLRLVSHELRTPLAVLKLQLERLRLGDSPLTPAQETAMERMESAALRLTELVESMLQHARIEGGKLEVHVERFSLVKTVAEVVEGFRSQAERKSIALDVEVAPDLPLLNSDVRLVRLILMNLLGNAVKFTDRGSVTLQIEFAAGAHRLKVRDTGRGIPVRERAGIFEPFYQLEPTRQKHTPGVGLGLALVREMVTALKGNVDVESDVGLGSTFTVTVPDYERPVDGRARTAEASAARG